jgi:hypothetical protein
MVDIIAIPAYAALPPHMTRRQRMLPTCWTDGAEFSIPTFDVVPSDVEGFMEELWEFPSANAQFIAVCSWNKSVARITHITSKSPQPVDVSDKNHIMAI